MKASSFKVGDKVLAFDDWGFEGETRGSNPDDYWYPCTITRLFQQALNGPDDLHEVADILLDNGKFIGSYFVGGLKAKE